MGQFYHVTLDPRGDVAKGPRVHDFKAVFDVSSADIQSFWQITDRNQVEQRSVFPDEGLLLKRINPAPSTACVSLHLRNEAPQNVLTMLLLLSGRKLDADAAVASMFQEMIGQGREGDTGQTLLTLNIGHWPSPCSVRLAC